MTREQLIRTPIFTPFDDKFHATTNIVSVTDAERNRILADGIPALSHAVGSTSVSLVLNTNMNALLKRTGIEGKWPDNNTRWLHSDVRAFAYSFVYPLYNQLVSTLKLDSQE